MKYYWIEVEDDVDMERLRRLFPGIYRAEINGYTGHYVTEVTYRELLRAKLIDYWDEANESEYHQRRRARYLASRRRD